MIVWCRLGLKIDTNPDNYSKRLPFCVVKVVAGGWGRERGMAENEICRAINKIWILKCHFLEAFDRRKFFNFSFQIIREDLTLHEVLTSSTQEQLKNLGLR